MEGINRETTRVLQNAYLNVELGVDKVMTVDTVRFCDELVSVRHSSVATTVAVQTILR